MRDRRVSPADCDPHGRRVCACGSWFQPDARVAGVDGPEGALLSTGETLRMASLAELREQAERFSRMDARDSSQGRAIYNQVVSGVHEMMASIDRLVAEGVPRPEIADAAAPARQAMAASPFAARLQTWPRGYPGDFETIEYLVDAINRAEP